MSFNCLAAGPRGALKRVTGNFYLQDVSSTLGETVTDLYNAGFGTLSVNAKYDYDYSGKLILSSSLKALSRNYRCSDNKRKKEKTCTYSFSRTDANNGICGYGYSYIYSNVFRGSRVIGSTTAVAIRCQSGYQLNALYVGSLNATYY